MSIIQKLKNRKKRKTEKFNGKFSVEKKIAYSSYPITTHRKIAATVFNFQINTVRIHPSTYLFVRLNFQLSDVLRQKFFDILSSFSFFSAKFKCLKKRYKNLFFILLYFISLKKKKHNYCSPLLSLLSAFFSSIPPRTAN